MSNKNLLNENTVRRFMKLAEIEPLTGQFVQKLTESDVDEGKSRGDDDTLEERDSKDDELKQEVKHTDDDKVEEAMHGDDEGDEADKMMN